MALARIAQHALGAALAAPVERRDGEAADAELRDHLEIFLDRLGAAGKDADRAAARRERRPAGKAHAHIIRGLQIAGDGALGHRIGGDGVQSHGFRFMKDAQRGAH